jgi:hypothetical protein
MGRPTLELLRAVAMAHAKRAMALTRKESFRFPLLEDDWVLLEEYQRECRRMGIRG